jgi:hypothetical protein
VSQQPTLRIRRLRIVVPAERRADAHMIGRLSGQAIGSVLSENSRIADDTSPQRLVIDGAGLPPAALARRAADTLLSRASQPPTRRKGGR